MSIFSQVFGNGFDSNSVEPQQDYEVLPPGKYPVVCENAEVKTTKKGDGHYLEVCVQIVDGQYRGRKLWSRMNIDNPSEVAQRIGLSQLAGLCKAVGIAVLSDEKDLLGKSCIANVKVKDEQNEIRSWSASGGVDPEQTAGRAVRSTQPTQPTQPDTSPMPANRPPWAR
jgi:hypothetical protein